MEQFDEEMSVFEGKLQEWLLHRPGQWVAIKGQEVLGFYPSMGDAFRDLKPKLVDEPFLLEQVVRDQQYTYQPVLKRTVNVES